MNTQSCFVFECWLDGKGGLSTDKNSPQNRDRPRWIHLDYSIGNAETELLALGLDPHICESLVRIDTRPRAVTTDEGVFIALRGVNSNPGSDPEDMVSLRMWIEPGRLITVRQRRIFSVQDVRATLDNNIGPHDIPSLLIAIVERLADRISDFVDAIESHLEEHETDVESGKKPQIRHQVSLLRRQTAVVRRFLAPQRDALDNLFRHSGGILNEDQAYSIREQSDRITRYVEDLDLIRERALVVQEELLNQIAQEQNARMYVLAVVTAIFLPITFITGMFGMNVAGLPGTDQAASFWLLCGVMLTISIGVLAIFRIRRWI